MKSVFLSLHVALPFGDDPKASLTRGSPLVMWGFTCLRLTALSNKGLSALPSPKRCPTKHSCAGQVATSLCLGEPPPIQAKGFSVVPLGVLSRVCDWSIRLSRFTSLLKTVTVEAGQNTPQSHLKTAHMVGMEISWAQSPFLLPSASIYFHRCFRTSACFNSLASESYFKCIKVHC